MDTGLGEGEWLTYDQIAKLRGTAKVGAIRWVQRHKLRRQPGNDGLVRILVPPDVLAQTDAPRRSAPNSSQNGAAAFETALAAIREAHAGELTALRDQLQDQRSRAERAEARGDRLRQELDAVREELDRKREVEARRLEPSRWERLRAAWRGQ